MSEAVTLRMRQGTDLGRKGWDDGSDSPNGPRTRQDFEVDEYWSSTNTDFGGSDPGRVAETKLEATFDPRGDGL